MDNGDRASTERGRQEPSGQASRILRPLAKVSWEVVSTLLQVVVFFLGFMAILTLSFPRGSGLTDLYGDFVGSKARDAVRLGLEDLEPVPFVAVLSDVRRQVKERAADAVAWSSADTGLQMVDEHAIQTLNRSSASILFEEDAELQLGPNSLVVIKRPERRLAKSRMASLVVLGGQVRGRIEHGTRRSLSVVTAGTASELRPDEATGAEFTVRSNPDESATITVLAGSGEITSQGQTVEIPANHSLTVHPRKPPQVPVAIPDPPSPREPADGTSLTYGAIPPRIRFQWDAESKAEGYRLVIARDPDFEEIVFAEVQPETEMVQGNLEQGDYYWKVIALNGGAESRGTDARTLHIERDATGPTLRVDLPSGMVHGDRLEIRGVTEPGARLIVGDVRVEPSASGEFVHALLLKPGPNLVVVEAIDVAGNVTYFSEYVNAKF